MCTLTYSLNHVFWFDVPKRKTDFWFFRTFWGKIEVDFLLIFAFLFFVSGDCIQIGTERHRNASRIASNAKNDKFPVRIPFGVYFGVLRAFGAIFNFAQKKERRKTPRKCKKTKKSLAASYFPTKRQYHRRKRAWLPCSVWERVLPLHYGHQAFITL